MPKCGAKNNEKTRMTLTLEECKYLWELIADEALDPKYNGFDDIRSELLDKFRTRVERMSTSSHHSNHTLGNLSGKTE